MAMKQVLWRKHNTKHKIMYQAYTVQNYSNPGLDGLSEDDLDPVQDWCETNDCGKRMSFDLFQFRNETEVTMFLLRWS